MGEDPSPFAESRLKFLCSFGGRILPRPPDGHLKYVGGETRVLTTPRPISFSELRERIATVCDSDVVVKYQLAPEDLDALVSIKSDEDVRHMVEEYDRLEAARSSACTSPTSSGSTSTACAPRFRIYLFPVANGVRLQPVNSMEHRYIDAVNGIHLSSRKSNNHGVADVFPIPSPESSPGSANGEIAAPDPGGISSNRWRAMHKAHSSPNLQQTMSDSGGGARVHQHLRYQYPHYGSLQAAHYGGPPTRMGGAVGGRGGCLHCPIQNLRPSGNRRYGVPHGTHQGVVGCGHVDEFCCTRRSAEGCPGLPHP